MTLAEELRGEIRIPIRAAARMVILNGRADKGESAVEQRARMLKLRAKSSRQWHKRKMDPTFRAAGAIRKREWLKNNPARRREIQQAWVARNREWHRAYQREWARRKREARKAAA